MTTKNSIICLIGVIVIGGAIYFSMNKTATTVTVQPISVTKEEVAPKQTDETTPAPTSDASTDEIIDYIVDGQSQDEVLAVQKTLEASSTPIINPAVSTNF
jgi:hypothetical protein